MKKIRKIKVRGKVIKVRECKNVFSKARGLMFKKNPKPLLFTFDKPTRQSIHSFFCDPFIAIWFNESGIIEEKIVRPFSLFVKPKKPFTFLVEIPLKNNNRNFWISDENRKI
jgi:uncharacterized membrane protein (UPF0127 family)